ncbi:sensor histidine kinase [Saccharothrix deserti]|uniref:sensor histidine kinase n=1 Tax=Saccharothrix deserti TaxID=2593674 RepID=UPI00131C38CF|nr:sensor histidine kinase [Saccharothrix deserti]
MTETWHAGAGWLGLFRWGPYALLGLGVLVSAATADDLMSTGEVYAAATLTGCALLWQLGWDRALRSLPDQSCGRCVYFTVRTVFALLLSGLNPFFSIYAVMGYFDAARQLRESVRRWGLLAVATTLAIAQASPSGGFLPDDALQWTVFTALLVLHTSLALLLDRFNHQADEQRRRQRDTIAELERAVAENKALQAQLVVQAREAGTADERRRLAAEIHDTLAQGLTGIITQLRASLDTTDRRAAREHVEQAVALARHSLGEARRSVHDLAPGPLEHQTLPEALDDTATRWSTSTSTPVEFTVTGAVQPLHAELDTALLRITEEALGNVAKHAGAERVGITLTYFDDEVTLDIRDDGRGFDPSAVPPRSAHGGFGLAGMRIRAERVGGRVEVESEQGDGTAVAVRVPLVRHDS